MKRFLILFSILFCTTVFAHTIEWYVDNTLLSTTTCESGDNITPPTVPEKFGYHFRKWKSPYTPIEYLESTGTQYIDTGYKLSSNNVNIQTIFMPSKVSSPGNRLSGSYTQGLNLRGFSFYIWNRLTIGCGGTDIQTNITMHISNIYTLNLQAKNGVLTGVVNDINVNGTYTNTIVNNLNLYLFGPNEASGSAYNFYGKIYKYQIYDNDVLVRDFIPVLDPDGTPCMYDKVENKHYYNAGIGQFIAGPVL